MGTRARRSRLCESAGSASGTLVLPFYTCKLLFCSVFCFLWVFFFCKATTLARMDNIMPTLQHCFESHTDLGHSRFFLLMSNEENNTYYLGCFKD